MKKNLAILLLAYCVASVEREGEGGIWACAGPFLLARAQIPPSPSTFNAGHAGYLIARQVRTWVVLEKRNIASYSTRYATMLQNKLRVS